jgi:hypothetical protein
VLHTWINRARADPAAELAACRRDRNGCADARCYEAREPLAWSDELARAARFHSDEMLRQGYFGHDSICTVVADIASSYPERCNGSASCACVRDARRCAPSCTSARERVALFGGRYTGEVLSTSSDPVVAFEAWMHEPTTDPTCEFTFENGHRWLLLESSGALGAGVAEDSTVELGRGGPPGRIPSGAHHPRHAASVEVWVHWYERRAPSAVAVNVGGDCQRLSLRRGTPRNGSWTAAVSGLDASCHPYYFELRDAEGERITYPERGSFVIGRPERCRDWIAERAPSCLPR